MTEKANSAQGGFGIRTKIVCTLGPSSSSPEVLVRMARAGMNIARLNFSHGSHKEHGLRLKTVRRVSERLGRPLGLLQDLPGPKLRVGKFAEASIQLRAGATFTLTVDPVVGDEKRVSVNYKGLPEDVEEGDLIYLADGTIKLEVRRVKGSDVVCRVVTPGELVSGKGVNIPSLHLRIPTITERDIEHLKFGVEQGVDFVAVSFVRSAEDISQAKKLVDECGGEAAVVAKIEKAEAVKALEAIVGASDAVMVARGDLGVELEVERVPLVQKEIIKTANIHGRPVITATQILESMVNNPRPTRAEVTDVANAILDGTDALMLSEETAIGRYPVESVGVLAKVAAQVEGALPYPEILASRRPWLRGAVEDVISFAACEVALDLKVKAIVTPTRSGSTARWVSRCRPQAPILALTPSPHILRQMLLSWGVYPSIMERVESVERFFEEADRVVVGKGLGKAGEPIVIIAGDPKGPRGTTDLLKVHILSSSQTSPPEPTPPPC